jgi:hypothetical protein
MRAAAPCTQAQPNINIMFLTTEVTTPAYYPGQDKHRLVGRSLLGRLDRSDGGTAAGRSPAVRRPLARR